MVVVVPVHLSSLHEVMVFSVVVETVTVVCLVCEVLNKVEPEECGGSVGQTNEGTIPLEIVMAVVIEASV